jgi:hypothetical protein
VLAANAGDAVLRRYDQDLDMAFEQARAQGDLTPLVQTVRRWWFEADAWLDGSDTSGLKRIWRASDATARRHQTVRPWVMSATIGA